MRKLIVPALLLAASSAFAQTDRAARFMDNCQRNGGDDERYCEVRNFTVPAARALNVDGRENGGITVHGWDRADVVVTAMIQANGESMSAAQAIAKAINIVAASGQIRSDGPSMEGR